MTSDRPTVLRLHRRRRREPSIWDGRSCRWRPARTSNGVRPRNARSRGWLSAPRTGPGSAPWQSDSPPASARPEVPAPRHRRRSGSVRENGMIDIGRVRRKKDYVFGADVRFALSSNSRMRFHSLPIDRLAGAKCQHRNADDWGNQQQIGKRIADVRAEQQDDKVHQPNQAQFHEHLILIDTGHE